MVNHMNYLDKTGLSQVWGKIDSLFSRKSDSGSMITPPSNSELEKYLNGEASSLTGNEPIVVNNLSTIAQYIKDSMIIYNLSVQNESVVIYNDGIYGSGTINTTINPSLSVVSSIGGILYDDGTKTFTVPKKTSLSINFSGTGYVSRNRQGDTRNCIIYISIPNLINQFVAVNFGTLHGSSNGGSKELHFSITKTVDIPSDSYTFKTNLRAYGVVSGSSLVTHTFKINNFKINISSV